MGEGSSHHLLHKNRGSHFATFFFFIDVHMCIHFSVYVHVQFYLKLVREKINTIFVSFRG